MQTVLNTSKDHDSREKRSLTARIFASHVLRPSTLPFGMCRIDRRGKSRESCILLDVSEDRFKAVAADVGLDELHCYHADRIAAIHLLK